MSRWVTLKDRRRVRIEPRRGKRYQRTIFFPPKSEYYAEIVKLDTPANALLSANRLLDEFGSAKTASKKRMVKRVTVLAANRAKVMAGNARLSLGERREAREIQRIYKNAYEQMRI